MEWKQYLSAVNCRSKENKTIDFQIRFFINFHSISNVDYNHENLKGSDIAQSLLEELHDLCSGEFNLGDSSKVESFMPVEEQVTVVQLCLRVTESQKLEQLAAPPLALHFAALVETIISQIFAVVRYSVLF